MILTRCQCVSMTTVRKRGVSREATTIVLSMTLRHHFQGPSGHYYPQPPDQPRGTRARQSGPPMSVALGNARCVRCGQTSPLSWHQKLIVVLQTPFISAGLGCIKVCVCTRVCACVKKTGDRWVWECLEPVVPNNAYSNGTDSH